MSEKAEVSAKKNIIEVFMGGCKKGFYIGVEMILPAMILGYAIVQFLTLTGLVDIVGNIFGPVMGIFGLPGEAVVVLISAFFSKAAGAATAANMYATLIIPCMLMGTLIGHYARIVLVANVSQKYRTIMLAIPIIDSIVGMLIMRFVLMLLNLA